MLCGVVGGGWVEGYISMILYCFWFRFDLICSDIGLLMKLISIVRCCDFLLRNRLIICCVVIMWNLCGLNCCDLCRILCRML